LIHTERLIQTLFELIRIDSETGEEAAVSSFLKEKFSKLGFVLQEDQAKAITGHGANNLILKLPGTTAGTPIFFGTHMDTACPGKRICPAIRNGYIVSDGRTILGADDKAGIAALIEAFTVVQAYRIPHADLQIIITAGEESGLLGARALNSDLILGQYGFELDSVGPVGEITIAAPFQSRIDVDLFAKAAKNDGMVPDSHGSALTMAKRAITRMPLGRIDSETTAGISRFAGNSDTHAAAGDHVYLLAEVRSLNRSKLDRQLNLMTRAFKQAAAEIGGTAGIRPMLVYPGYRFTPAEPIVRAAEAAVLSVGRKPRLCSSSGGSDANIFNEKGLTALNLGIGYEQIHTLREKLPVSELVKTSELIMALMNQATV
jgi:tripeptide aminopeptidase